MCLAPTLGQQALIERVGVFWLPCRVSDNLECFGSELGAEKLRILILKRKAQPDIKIIGEFRVWSKSPKGGSVMTKSNEPFIS
jgi:hypothetical protein